MTGDGYIEDLIYDLLAEIFTIVFAQPIGRFLQTGLEGQEVAHFKEQAFHTGVISNQIEVHIFQLLLELLLNA